MAKPARQSIDLVGIDNARFNEACRLYFLWKDLNSSLRSVTTRGINFPEAISEQLGCYAMGYLWNKGSYGDAQTPDGLVVEMKATSNYDGDLTSFSPTTIFDKLVFLRLDYVNNILHVYDLEMNSNDLMRVPVNLNQTVADQQAQGRRPRFSVIQRIIAPNQLEPTASIDIRTGQVYR